MRRAWWRHQHVATETNQDYNFCLKVNHLSYTRSAHHIYLQLISCYHTNIIPIVFHNDSNMRLCVYVSRVVSLFKFGVLSPRDILSRCSLPGTPMGRWWWRHRCMLRRKVHVKVVMSNWADKVNCGVLLCRVTAVSLCELYCSVLYTALFVSCSTVLIAGNSTCIDLWWVWCTQSHILLQFVSYKSCVICG